MSRKILKISVKLLRYTYNNILSFLLIVTAPIVYAVEHSVISPVLVKEYKVGYAKQLMHIVISTFCLINVFGNLLMFLMVDSRVPRGWRGSGVTCDVCRRPRPSDSWHCVRCGVCVLGRDHHCRYFSHCVGQRNQRYFLLATTYGYISLCYSTYYNFYYTLCKTKKLATNPEITEKIYYETLGLILPINFQTMIYWILAFSEYLFLFCIVAVLIGLWLFYLFIFHILEVLKGASAYERRENKKSPKRLVEAKKNFLKIFENENGETAV